MQAERTCCLRLHLLDGFRQVIEFIVDDASAEDARVLKVGGALHDRLSAQHHVRASRGRIGENYASAVTFARPQHIVPPALPHPVHVNCEVFRVKQAERENKSLLLPVGSEYGAASL